MEISRKNTRSAEFLAVRIYGIMNFAVITNAVIKRVHCMVAAKEEPVKTKPCTLSLSSFLLDRLADTHKTDTQKQLRPTEDKY